MSHHFFFYSQKIVKKIIIDFRDGNPTSFFSDVPTSLKIVAKMRRDVIRRQTKFFTSVDTDWR